VEYTAVNRLPANFALTFGRSNLPIPLRFPLFPTKDNLALLTKVEFFSWYKVH